MTRRICVATLCLLLTGIAVAQEGSIVRETVYSPSLEGNLLGDSPNREVTIYLPPSYDDGDNLAYPVVYLLHGYTGNHNLWTGGSYISGNIINSMKSWLADDKVGEMVLVMPNADNRFEGSWYTNSVASGNWSDFVVRDLVNYVDSYYNTLPQRESRAVFGHSMGGYGAVRLGMLHPGTFGCMGGLAGAYDMEDFISQYRTSMASASATEDWAQFSVSDTYIHGSFALAAAFAPNPDYPPFYCDFPFVYTDTKPTKIVEAEEVWNRFMEHDILKIVEGYIDVLLSMRAIYIECGMSDPHIGDARLLHDKLDSLGVKHIYREFPGDHFCCVMTSTGDALEVFSEAMAFDMLVGIEPEGKLTTTWGQMKSY